MRVSRLAAVLGIAAIGVAPQASAQNGHAPPGLEVVKNPTRRNGLWGTIGLGVGSESFSVPDSVQPLPWLARPTFNARIGELQASTSAREAS